MDLTAITLTELRYLLAVAETGHFGRAADLCSVTQPTLSTQLRKLEETLGVALIERGARRARLTPAGEQVVERARVVFEEMRAIGEVARGHAQPFEGTLRIGVIPTLAPYLLPVLLAPLQKQYPRLRLQVAENLTTLLLEQLSTHRLDAALLALPVSAPGVESMRLFEEPFWFLGAANHPLARRKTIRQADLAGQRMLLLTEGHCLRDQALAICGERADLDGDEFCATSLETLRQLVGAGLGCTLLPALAVPRLADRATAARPFHAPAPHRTIGLVWRRSFSRPEALRAIGESIRAIAESVLRKPGKAPSP